MSNVLARTNVNKPNLTLNKTLTRSSPSLALFVCSHRDPSDNIPYYLRRSCAAPYRGFPHGHQGLAAGATISSYSLPA